MKARNHPYSPERANLPRHRGRRSLQGHHSRLGVVKARSHPYSPKRANLPRHRGRRSLPGHHGRLGAVKVRSHPYSPKRANLPRHRGRRSLPGHHGRLGVVAVNRDGRRSVNTPNYGDALFVRVDARTVTAPAEQTALPDISFFYSQDVSAGLRVQNYKRPCQKPDFSVHLSQSHISHVHQSRPLFVLCSRFAPLIPSSPLTICSRTHQLKMTALNLSSFLAQTRVTISWNLVTKPVP